jgi:moderate conductance mechanosensitive channel
MRLNVVRRPGTRWEKYLPGPLGAPPPVVPRAPASATVGDDRYRERIRLAVGSLFPTVSSSTEPDSVTPHGISHWLSDHTSVLVTHASQIVTILLVMIIGRKIVVRAINRVVRHAAAASDTRTGRLLDGSGLLAGERRRQRTQAIGSVLRSFASAVIFGVGILMIISVMQIPVTPILASVSVIGAAVGFGARDLVTDFISGVFMILEDQYGVGDVIDTGEAKGMVEEVGLRVTKLRDADGVIWYVRNGAINRIGNQSQGWSRAVVDVPVAYAHDIDHVRAIMTKAAEELYADKAWTDRFLGESPQVVGVETLDGAYVIMRIQARTAPQKHFEVTRELRARLKTALDQEGIEIASLK